MPARNPTTNPAAPRKNVPACRLHKRSGQAVVTLNGRDHYLGPHGSDDSRRRYEELIGRWLVNGRRLPEEHRAEPLTVAEVLLRYVEYAQQHYARRRRAADIMQKIKYALRPVRELYGLQPAADFRAKALMVVRQKYIDTGVARATVNTRVQIVKRAFRWAAREELIPSENWYALSTVEGLRSGESTAADPGHVPPVDDAVVDAIHPYVSRQIWAMMELQRLTGMRPGEVCIMRGVDIDRTGPVWRFTPEHHKTEHKGRRRVVALGPRAQAVVTPFLRPGYLFSPADVDRERREALHAHRVTPLSCGNRPGTHRQRQPKRTPGERYDVDAYALAIDRACLRVWPLPDDLRPLSAETREHWYARLGPDGLEAVR